MRMKLLAAAAIITAIASPAMAMGPHARSEAVQQRQHQARMYYRHYHQGFWPGDVAAGVVGGAIGTAGAIATAPFGYDDDYYGGPTPYAW
jgi:hypothetical protein